ncbi:MAG: 4Fe-4S dicluster domain-containing protein [Thermonemataceae bacterium]|nr:4Fe-4S dicluster domain-containing protein [Thermonemataceae bacterium]
MAKQKLKPVVDFNSCGGKNPCVEVCPYNVFELKPIEKEDREKLNIKGKIKTFFNQHKAYVMRPDACESCGYCVTACPERAIKLVKV